MKQAFLFLVRHFPTALNEPGRERVRGQMEVPVDRERARELGPRVARLLARADVTRIYSSDIRRGIETARAIATHLPGVAVIHLPGLRTWDVGHFTGQLRRHAWPRIERYIKYSDEKIPGDERFSGESFDHFLDRWAHMAHSFVRQALANPAQRIALVIHGNMLWTAPAVLEGKKLDRFLYHLPPPGSVVRVRIRSRRRIKLEPLGA